MLVENIQSTLRVIEEDTDVEAEWDCNVKSFNVDRRITEMDKKNLKKKKLEKTARK